MYGKNTNNYFEKWKISIDSLYSVAVVDLFLERSYYFPPEENLYDKIDELGESKFLDWFYDHELQLSCDHKNYDNTYEDQSYIKGYSLGLEFLAHNLAELTKLRKENDDDAISEMLSRITENYSQFNDWIWFCKEIREFADSDKNNDEDSLFDLVNQGISNGFNSDLND